MEYSEVYPNMTLADIYTDIVIHHEGDDATYNVRVLQERDMADGMYDIAYHYAIGPDGSIYEGRDLGARGLHTLPNTGKIGIVLLGDFSPGYTNLDFSISIDLTDNVPTISQIDATKSLIVWLDNTLGIDRVAGHRDYPNNGNTVCPGDSAYPFIAIFQNLIR
jgi:hypothetical protein